jgi:hypothetical protein
VLYLPRRTIHSARTAGDEPSVHLTLGLAHRRQQKRPGGAGKQCLAGTGGPLDAAAHFDGRAPVGPVAPGGERRALSHTFWWDHVDAYCDGVCNDHCDDSCDDSCNGSCNSWCDSSCDLGYFSCDQDCDSSCDDSCDEARDGTRMRPLPPSLADLHARPTPPRIATARATIFALASATSTATHAGTARGTPRASAGGRGSPCTAAATATRVRLACHLSRTFPPHPILLLLLLLP